MTQAVRNRRYRARQRAAERLYQVPLSDRNLARLIEAGVVGNDASLDRSAVGAALAKIIDAALKKFRDA